MSDGRHTRCIDCSQPWEAHREGICPGSSSSTCATMNLPDGKTCADCRHIGFCEKFLGEDVRTNETCDWFPVRFVERAAAAGGGR